MRDSMQSSRTKPCMCRRIHNFGVQRHLPTTFSIYLCLCTAAEYCTCGRSSRKFIRALGRGRVLLLDTAHQSFVMIRLSWRVHQILSPMHLRLRPFCWVYGMEISSEDAPLPELFEVGLLKNFLHWAMPATLVHAAIVCTYRSA